MDALSAINVPRNAGCAAEVKIAIPGTMRPFIQIKNTVVMAIMPATGNLALKVTANSGTIITRAITRKVRTLPAWSAMRPIHCEVSKVAAPPNR